MTFPSPALLVRTLAALAISAGTARVAAQALVVSTGIAKGTYSVMLGQLAAVCGSDIGAPLVAHSASGSLESLTRLMDNEVQIAMVQTDVLYYRQGQQDLQRLKTLLVLHPEEVHLLARRPAARTTAQAGLDLLLGRQRRAPETLADLAGRRVAAFGGGQITARVIARQADLGYAVVDVPGPDEALAALDQGTVDAVLAVGGAPLPWLRKLGADYRLLPVPQTLADRLSRSYRAARISYPALAPDPVPTVATEALLLTQDYRGAALRQQLQRLRACARREIPTTITETPGNHPKWRSVDPSAPGLWAVFDPAPGLAATPVGAR